MSQRLRQITTFLLLAAYVTATSASGLLHDHGGSGRHDGGHRQAAHAYLHGSAPGDEADEVAQDDDALAATSAHDDDHDHNNCDHDDCAVCRFAGQRIIQAPAIVLCHLTDVSVAVAATYVPLAHATAALTTHSRAPPYVG